MDKQNTIKHKREGDIMADLHTIIKAVQTMEADDLNTVVTAIKDRRDYLRLVELRQFSKGDTVSFSD